MEIDMEELKLEVVKKKATQRILSNLEVGWEMTWSRAFVRRELNGVKAEFEKILIAELDRMARVSLILG
jgi:hypothetical protein